MPPPSALHWPLEALRQNLAPLLPGIRVLHQPELDSTSSQLMRAAHSGQRDPVLLVADVQTAGRGRMGKSWHSQGAEQALTFSLGLALQPQSWLGLSLIVGLALCQALDAQQQLGLRLKWPNDLWWYDPAKQRHDKLAGILVETVQIQGPQPYAVIGVGLNITSPVGKLDLAANALAPVGLVDILGAQKMPGTASAADCLQRIAPHLVRSVLHFAQHGFAAYASDFAQRDALRAKTVQLSDGRIGTAHGVDAQGCFLFEETGTGQIQALHSADISIRSA